MPRGRGGSVAAAGASTSAATTASYNAAATATSAAAAQKARESGSAIATPASSSHNLDDLVDSAQAVLAARAELAALRDAVSATKEEVRSVINFCVEAVANFCAEAAKGELDRIACGVEGIFVLEERVWLFFICFRTVCCFSAV